MNAVHRARAAVRGLQHRLAAEWTRQARSLPRSLRIAELVMNALAACAFAWMYRDTPAVAVVLVAGVAVIAAFPRALSLLFPGLIAATVFAADSSAITGRFLLISLVIALWHLDGLRRKGVVYTRAVGPLLRWHSLWLAGVLLVSGVLVAIGQRLHLALPGPVATLLVPAMVIIVAQLAMSRTDTL